MNLQERFGTIIVFRDCYGFIRPDNNTKPNLFLSISDLGESYKKPRVGDRVKYGVKTVYGKPRAENVELIARAGLESLREIANTQTPKGTLFEEDGSYFVIDSVTKLKVCIYVSWFETNLQANYINKLNQEVYYQPIKLNDTKKLIGVLKFRTFIPEVESLINGATCFAQISKKAYGWIDLSVCSIRIGKIFKRKLRDVYDQLEVGDYLEVKLDGPIDWRRPFVLNVKSS